MQRLIFITSYHVKLQLQTSCKSRQLFKSRENDTNAQVKSSSKTRNGTGNTTTITQNLNHDVTSSLIRWPEVIYQQDTTNLQPC